MSQRLRILVLDDNPDDRALALRALEKEYPDLQATEIIDEAGFQRVLEADEFDCVVTDYQLRWTTGLYVVQEVKERYPDVPIIMFTSTGCEEICAEGMKLGLNDYIVKKPQNYDRLPLAVRAGLEAAVARKLLIEREIELQQATEKLARALESEQEAREEAERANRLKDEFLATVSHELRTPLNAIMGWTQLIRRGRRSPEDLDRGLTTIERNVKSQTQIINDLLDISRIISGKLRLDVQPVEVVLVPVIEAALEAVQPAADAKEIRLQRTLDPLAGPVWGDANRLQQVVWNLLSNAVKFTPHGGHVQVALERVDSHAEITVSDTGEGIAPEFLPHIFDRLRQADSSTTRRHGGLGLGLAIVRHMIELHGGTVRAKSPGVGQGSTFIVALPLARRDEITAIQERFREG